MVSGVCFAPPNDMVYSAMRTHPLPSVGDRFGRLTVTAVGRYDTGRRVRVIPCRCDCGASTDVRHPELYKGKTRSCGCWMSEVTGNRNRTHGLRRTRLYRIWAAMKTRCANPNVPAYKDYGARGIAVCCNWRDSFADFHAWAMSNGYADGLEIDRIDNDRGYSPDNCRWVTRSRNVRNTRAVVLVTAFGETRCMMDWAADPRCAVEYCTLKTRIQRQRWEPERAITQPSRSVQPRGEM